MKKLWPFIVLAGIVLFLTVVNFVPGTLLTGGDNLHPEFNFPLNIERSLFAAWQEYQGVGLLGGMGHAADLLRQLFLWPFSLVIPTNQIRYLWTMFTLFIGLSGAYVLTRKVLSSVILRRNTTRDPEEISLRQLTDRNDKMMNLFPLLGSLFYLCNLATIQTYFTPFEVFTAHFASLPWLLWSAARYLEQPSKKRFAVASLILLLATPQGYVPTLFVVYLMAITVIMLVYTLSSWSGATTKWQVPLGYIDHDSPCRSQRRSAGRITFKQRFYRFFLLRRTSLQNDNPSFISLCKLYLIIFTINAFWMLPFAYFTVTSSSVNVNAKINQMATETIFQKNKEFGGIQDVVLLKGFWLNNVEPDKKGQLVYMMQAWRNHLDTFWITALGYLLFSIVLIGVVQAIRSKKPLLWSMAALFFLSITMLTTATPPFSYLNNLLREFIPLLNQIFRFPFTKFSILAALSFAVLFAVGITTLYNILQTRILNHISQKKYLLYTYFFIPTSILLLFCLPAFTGNLFYTKAQLVLPKEYSQLFSFFAHQDPNTRIANFPQPSFWDWKFYNWGYSGSGFLWYGIRQPILDRAFDVWSPYNEQYYFELSNALYTKDAKLFEKVLQKYQITWLLLDTSVVYGPSPKALFIPEFRQMVASLPAIKKTASFGTLEVYKVALPDKPKNYVFQTTSLPVLNAYNWTALDRTYADSGNYIAAEEKTTPTYTEYYPFRSLFSFKTQKENTFTMDQDNLSLSLHQQLPKSVPQKLHIPSFFETENIIPATFATRSTGKTLIITVTLRTPEIYIGNQKLYGVNKTLELFRTPLTKQMNLKLNINGIVNFHLDGAETTLGTTFLTLKQPNSVVLSGKSIATASQTISATAIKKESGLASQDISLPHTGVLTLKIPKITDKYYSLDIDTTNNPDAHNCDYFRQGFTSVAPIRELGEPALLFSAKNATTCTAYYSDTLDHTEGYAIFFDYANVTGRGLNFWIENIDQKYGPLNTFLPTDKTSHTLTFILPPQEQFGKAYAFHFENMSIGKDATENILGRLRVYQIPYAFATSLVFHPVHPVPTAQHLPVGAVSHPQESLYLVQPAPTSSDSVLSLAQAYNPGWKAYEVAQSSGQSALSLQTLFPFFFGKEVKEHVLINNWENGWILKSNKRQGTSDKNQEASEQIVIVFLPQYLEYVGFLLLIGTWSTIGTLYLMSLKIRRRSASH